MKSLHQIREHFGIGKKLFLAFGTVSLLTVGVGMLSWDGFEKQSQTQREIANQNVPAISQAMNLSNNISLLVASAPLLEGAESSQEKDEREKSVRQLLELALQGLAKLRSKVNDHSKLDEIA